MWDSLLLILACTIQKGVSVSLTKSISQCNTHPTLTHSICLFLFSSDGSTGFSSTIKLFCSKANTDTVTVDQTQVPVDPPNPVWIKCTTAIKASMSMKCTQLLILPQIRVWFHLGSIYLNRTDCDTYFCRLIYIWNLIN